MTMEYALDEVKQMIKKVEKDNKLKTLIFVGTGIAFVVIAIIFVVVRVRDKMLGDYSFDDWSELDDMDYDDYDVDFYDNCDIDDFDESYTENEE